MEVQRFGVRELLYSEFPINDTSLDIYRGLTVNSHPLPNRPWDKVSFATAPLSPPGELRILLRTRSASVLTRSSTQARVRTARHTQLTAQIAESDVGSNLNHVDSCQLEP